ncbi:unnamed protein product [Prunus armeniaca]|uniref:Uncharacterized protein n=1 Tax=Prunus armeniaca TaxID=36596 RepID=A0A6J5VBA3_PRUAR|nr:unnamed protein product [Prunus armeniaca]
MGEAGKAGKNAAEMSESGDEGESAKIIGSREEIKGTRRASYERQWSIKWPADTFDEVATFDNLSIFHVPNKLRKVDDNAYSPRIISIGPYHRKKGNHELVTMIEHKGRYMRYFFDQIKDPQESLQVPLEFHFPVYNLDTTVRRSYAGGARDHDAESLEHMVSFDGIFILELFLRYDQYCKKVPLIDQSDAIFNNGWMIPALRRDLALLENQIPFFVLQELYDVVKPRIVNYKPPHSITCLALNFFEPMKEKEMIKDEPEGTEYKHLLDLLHKLYHPASCLLKNEPRSNFENWGFDFCACDLLEAGVVFLCNSDHSYNITFTKGVMRIPQVYIDDRTTSLLRNLIAYEQCSLSSKQHITSYAILMKSLIRSPHDVTLLREQGIMNQNWIKDEEYLTYFNGILDEVVVKDFCFGKLCKQVNAYASKYWFRRRVRCLYNTYFSTAWSMISFVAAVCLFVLTIAQTYFAMHQAHQ